MGSRSLPSAKLPSTPGRESWRTGCGRRGAFEAVRVEAAAIRSRGGAPGYAIAISGTCRTRNGQMVACCAVENMGADTAARKYRSDHPGPRRSQQERRHAAGSWTVRLSGPRARGFQAERDDGAGGRRRGGVEDIDITAGCVRGRQADTDTLCRRGENAGVAAIGARAGRHVPAPWPGDACRTGHADQGGQARCHHRHPAHLELPRLADGSVVAKLALRVQ